MVEAQAPNITEKTPNEDTTQSWWTFQRWVILGVGIFIGIYLLIFLIGFGASLAWPESAAGFFSYFRDLITIGLSISIIAIAVAIGILIIQIARFINLLRSEVKPISEDAKVALKNIRVTTAFVQKHAVAPIIRFQGFVAGFIAFLREIVIITKLLQKRKDADDTTTSDAED